MKQLLQRLDDGRSLLVEAPVPVIAPHQILVETRASVVSAGTERMLVGFGQANLLQKARQQPERVKDVLDKVRTDGLAATLDAVRSKLAEPIPLGYCSAGVVVEAGADAGWFVPGTRVVTNGPHAEMVRVPWTLAAAIPDGVPFEAAAFTPLAAIALQGVRLAAPTLGETVVVYGLGLIGLVAVQLLRANGCRVIGVDRVSARLALGERFGAEVVDGGAGPVAPHVVAATGGSGADAVLLTLASDSDEPVHEAARMARQRGRLVLVGVTGLGLSRDEFYKKELTFQVSCSYGAGRYDPSFEGGHDYPVGHVRWTAQRNFEAVLALMAGGQLDPLPLVTHRFPFAEAPRAMALLTSEEPSLGIVLSYPGRDGASVGASVAPQARRVALPAAAAAREGAVVVGAIGAGNFATRTMLPIVKRAGARLHTIVDAGGVPASVAGSKFGFARAASDVGAVLEEPGIAAVLIMTRHDSHARLAIAALERGKHVFVEKPLAVDEPSLDAVIAAARASKGTLTVGFNRRFAPLAVRLREALASRAGPVSLVMTVNAGAIPRDHWTQDPAVGGGRIVGEAVHWMDLARSLTGSAITDVQVRAARDRDGRPVDDVAHLALGFANGSTAVIHYLATGSKRFPKERIEAFVDGRTLAIDNWRRWLGYGSGLALWRPFARQDKGHAAEVRAWLEAVKKGGPATIPLDELEEVSRWAIRAAAAARGRGQGPAAR